MHADGEVVMKWGNERIVMRLDEKKEERSIAHINEWMLRVGTPAEWTLLDGPTQDHRNFIEFNK